MVRGIRLLGYVVLAASCFAFPAWAQTGQIRGTVRDAQGAALSGATVRVTNQATNAARRTTTAGDGSYVVADLVTGTYTVNVTLPGLRMATQRDVRVAAPAEVTLDFTLQPLVLEEITVTAMLREQPLAEVPFSMAAPTGEVLRSRGAENVEAIAANVAGFSVQNLGPGQSQVAMRGVSSGQIARDQPGVKEQVASYLDDSPVSLSLFTPDLDLFDVARVEVLRGPQGTLFGASSLAGTVRYISNQPEVGVGRIFGELGTSWIDGGSPGSNARIGANVPLGNTAALRLVAYSSRMGGWMDAVQPNFMVNEDVNSGVRTGVRAALRFVPNDRLSITPRLVVQQVRMDGWNRIDAFNILANPYTTSRDPVTLGERQLFTQIAEPFTDDFLLGDVNVLYNLGRMNLNLITSYTKRDVLVVRDAGALTSSITGGSIGLPENIYTLDAPLDDATTSTVWTQEARLSGGSDRVRWLVGGFYSSNQRDYGQSLLVVGFDELAAPILGAPAGFTRGLRARVDELFYSDLAYDLSQYALFAEATATVTPRIDLTAGLRWYNFDENREQIFDGIFGNDNNGTSLVSQPGAIDASGVAPRFIASWRASDAVTVNAQASRGFRLGGINDPLNVPLCTAEDLATFSGRDTWKDETAWNYEVGAKTRLMGGRAALNVSAFHMAISDLQLTVTAGSCSSRLIFNVDKARSQGLDIEFTAAPTENLDFSVSASLNNAELQSTVSSGGNPVSGMAEGNRLPSVPQIQLSGAATYQWMLRQGSRAFVTGSFQHTGSRFTSIDDHGFGFCPPGLPNCPFGTVDLLSFERGGGQTIGGALTDTLFTFNPELPAYSVINLRVGLIRDAWEIALYANNVFDERAFLALDRERGTRARVGYLTNQPRTIGASLRFNY
jgi:iron complex outermembrane receptor protein